MGLQDIALIAVEQWQRYYHGSDSGIASEQGVVNDTRLTVRFGMRRVCSTSSSALRCSIFFMARSAMGLVRTRSASTSKLGRTTDGFKIAQCFLNCGEVLPHSRVSRLRAEARSRCACYQLNLGGGKRHFCPGFLDGRHLAGLNPLCNRVHYPLRQLLAFLRKSERSCPASTSVNTFATRAMSSTRLIS